MTWIDDDFSADADKAEQALKALSKLVLQGRTPPPGPYTLFNHNLQALKRTQDVHRTLKRMASNRRKLAYLDRKEQTLRPKDWPAGLPFEENIQRIFADAHDCNSHLEMDFETLYQQGSILLDQLAVLLCHVGGLDRALWFSRLIQRFEKESDDPIFPAPLKPVWSANRASLLQHYAGFRIFRDRFIVHHDLPYQRGSSRDSIRGEFKLSSLISPGWHTDEDEQRAYNELLAIMPDSSSGTGRILLLESYLQRIHELPESKRREVHRLATKLGFQSPKYQEVGRNLLEITANLANSMRNVAESNIGNVALNLGH